MTGTTAAIYHRGRVRHAGTALLELPEALLSDGTLVGRHCHECGRAPDARTVRLSFRSPEERLFLAGAAAAVCTPLGMFVVGMLSSEEDMRAWTSHLYGALFLVLAPLVSRLATRTPARLGRCTSCTRTGFLLASVTTGLFLLFLGTLLVFRNLLHGVIPTAAWALLDRSQHWMALLLAGMWATARYRARPYQVRLLGRRPGTLRLRVPAAWFTSLSGRHPDVSITLEPVLPAFTRHHVLAFSAAVAVLGALTWGAVREPLPPSPVATGEPVHAIVILPATLYPDVFTHLPAAGQLVVGEETVVRPLPGAGGWYQVTQGGRVLYAQRDRFAPWPSPVSTQHVRALEVVRAAPSSAAAEQSVVTPGSAVRVAAVQSGAFSLLVEGGRPAGWVRTAVLEP